MRAARLLLFLAIALPVPAQLQQQIARAAAQARGRVGVACALPGQALDCSLNPGASLPMQSVCKLPIAMATLHAVEQGRLRLSQKLRFVPSRLIAGDGYSPLRDQHPRGPVELPIEDLLRRAITQSDNVASDVLLRSIGGPGAANAYLRSLGITGISIRDDENTVDRNERLQYRNAAQPRALVLLLEGLSSGTALSPQDTQLLLSWMAATQTGSRRIRALLPPGTPVADKTGTAGQHRPTMNATNDIALITLPDGRKLALAILVSDARAPFAHREEAIARIAQAVYTAALR